MLPEIKLTVCIELFFIVLYGLLMAIYQPGKFSEAACMFLMVYSAIALGIALLNANDSISVTVALLGSTGGMAAGIVLAMVFKASFMQFCLFLLVYAFGFGFGVILFHPDSRRWRVAERSMSFVLEGIVAGAIYALQA